MFSQRSLGTSVLMFESLNHFELILVNRVIQGFNFILHVVIQFSQNCLLKRLSFPLSRISVLFQWSMGLFLCQSHTVLWYSLKSGQTMPPGVFFFLTIALAIWDLLWFHMNFRIMFNISLKNVIGDNIESIDSFG